MRHAILDLCPAPTVPTPLLGTLSPSRWVTCSHTLSGLPCMNRHPHSGNGRGCVHYSSSGVPDRHDVGDDE